jgi:hypothetical protein
VIAATQAEDLAGILELRGDPMAACESPWLKRFQSIPENAAPPLAMSGPHPRAVGSYGAECIEWARRELGLTVRWWQGLAITRQLEHDAAGELVWREIIDSGPRRIGKSVRLRIVALWRTANAERIGEKQLSMLVSKDLAVGKEIHRGSWRWAEQVGWKVIRLNGGQEVEAPDESRWLLRAPTAAYGYDVGYGQVDESWGVDPQAITDGIEPALLERLWSQLHLTSTAHVRATSLMRRRLLAALRDSDLDVLLMLWGARPDADIGLEATWRSASPHWSQARRDLVARKFAAAMAGQDEPEFDDPDPVRGWAAQYLNVWPLLLAADDVVMPKWGACASAEPPGGVAALGVAVDPDRVWISVGSCSNDAVPHLGAVSVLRGGDTVVLRRRLDTDRAFVVAEVARIQRELGIPVVIDRKGGADALGKSLDDAGVDVTWVSRDDFATASAGLFDAVAAGEVVHGDYLELNDAVRAAGKQKFGDRWVWARHGGDVSMLEAVTWAHWSAVNAPAYDLLNSFG